MIILNFQIKLRIKKKNDDFFQSHRAKEWQYSHLNPGLNDSNSELSKAPAYNHSISMCLSNFNV